jgi:N-acetylglucosaminyldiphosphoundecaprenol N-acetyl-beta-D-mannosaminyltransferase
MLSLVTTQSRRLPAQQRTDRGEGLQAEAYSVLGVPIAKITLDDAIDRVKGWKREGSRGHVVTFANVHMVVDAKRDPKLGAMLREASMNCPDGSPLFWVGRHRFGRAVSQVSGPDFMPALCEQGVKEGYKHYLYGGAPGVVEAAAQKLAELFPGIEIVGIYSPPFRALTEEEDEAVCRRINESGADFVWVCLGCPKQEKWMAEHRDRLEATALLGVGQAVDILAGKRMRAPRVIRLAGLEWFYRLLREPGRLWKRYLTTNFLFIVWFARDLLFARRSITSK